MNSVAKIQQLMYYYDVYYIDNTSYCLLLAIHLVYCWYNMAGGISAIIIIFPSHVFEISQESIGREEEKIRRVGIIIRPANNNEL